MLKFYWLLLLRFLCTPIKGKIVNLPIDTRRVYAFHEEYISVTLVKNDKEFFLYPSTNIGVAFTEWFYLNVNKKIEDMGVVRIAYHTHIVFNKFCPVGIMYLKEFDDKTYSPVSGIATHMPSKNLHMVE